MYLEKRKYLIIWNGESSQPQLVFEIAGNVLLLLFCCYIRASYISPNF